MKLYQKLKALDSRIEALNRLSVQKFEESKTYKTRPFAHAKSSEGMFFAELANDLSEYRKLIWNKYQRDRREKIELG